MLCSDQHSCCLRFPRTGQESHWTSDWQPYAPHTHSPIRPIFVLRNGETLTLLRSTVLCYSLNFQMFPVSVKEGVDTCNSSVVVSVLVLSWLLRGIIGQRCHHFYFPSHHWNSLLLGYGRFLFVFLSEHRNWFSSNWKQPVIFIFLHALSMSSH